MIVVRDLQKHFHDPGRGQITAVDRLTFNVKPGEVYGLLGPNGAGKTTSLRMLATLMPPDGGSIEVFGANAASEALTVRERLAYVPAESGLPQRLTPLEVVTLFARIQGISAPQDTARRLLSELGAERFIDTPCSGLSTGMKRRVVLARALVHGPSALLLDEPTDGLDVQGRRDVLRLVRAQAEAGRAVVLSSHIMGEVEQVVDRIGVIARGTLQDEGTVAEVLERTNTRTLDDAFLALTEPPGGE